VLKTTLLHPEILAVLGSAGRGDQVLVVDGNYPFSTHSHAKAKRVFLNLAPGLLEVPQVLEVVRDTVPVEKYEVIEPTGEADVPVFREFSELFQGVPCERLERAEFHAAAESADTVLTVVTGDQRPYATILLTVGAVEAEDDLPTFEHPPG
jgi:L-fucose mutarotase